MQMFILGRGSWGQVLLAASASGYEAVNVEPPLFDGLALLFLNTIVVDACKVS